MLIAAVPAALIGYAAKRWARHDATDSGPEFLLVLWLTLATWTWSGLALLRVAEMPMFDWHACRLAPVIAWARGVELYSGHDSGPVSSHIYGPVWPLAMLPAALGRSVTSIIHIGGVLTVLWFILPATALIIRAAGRNTAALLAVVCLAFWSLNSRSLNYAAYWIHVDAVALGLTAIACAALLRPDERHANGLCLIVAALAAALAIWTKQTLAPIALGLPALLWLRGDRRRAIRLFAMLVVTLLVLLGVFLLFLDGQKMWFNMVSVPSRHPFRLGATQGLLMSVSALLQQMALPMILLAISTWLGGYLRIGQLRAWLRENDSWWMPLFLGVLLMPAAILGFAKAGGDYNNFAYPVFLVLVAALIGLTRAGARRLLLLLSVVLTLLAAGWPQQLRERIWLVTHIDINPQEAAYQLARRYPMQVYLPWNTLSTLLADGELYHFDWGLYDRKLAGLALTERHLRAHMPAKMKIVAIPRSAPTDLSRPRGVIPIEIPDLPGYDVYISSQ